MYTVCFCVYVFARLCVCVCVCACVLCVCLSISVYVWLFIRMYVYACLYVWCVRMYICLYLSDCRRMCEWRSVTYETVKISQVLFLCTEMSQWLMHTYVASRLSVITALTFHENLRRVSENMYWLDTEHKILMLTLDLLFGVTNPSVTVSFWSQFRVSFDKT